MSMVVFAALIPLTAYPILKKLGKFSQVDSGAIAAHYGSVSAVTFAGGAANMEQLKIHLGLSKRLHDSCMPVLSGVHEDCGAGAVKEDLFKAAEIARSLGFDPRLFFIKLDGTWEEVNAS